MKINKTVKSFFLIFSLLDFCVLIYSLVFKNYIWFLNTQVAFLSSLFIIIASYLSYRKNIQGRILNLDMANISNKEDRDKIDEIDDPYDLYTDYEEIPEEELSSDKIKEIIKEEKKKVSKNSIKNTIFSAGGFLSIYRILGYGILIFGFFALKNNQMFIPFAFIMGITIVPIGILLSKIIFKSNN